MECPRCQYDNPAGVKFCGEFWAKATALTQHCHFPLSPRVFCMPICACLRLSFFLNI